MKATSKNVTNTVVFSSTLKRMRMSLFVIGASVLSACSSGPLESRSAYRYIDEQQARRDLAVPPSLVAVENTPLLLVPDLPQSTLAPAPHIEMMPQFGRSQPARQPKESTKLTELSKVEDKATVNALADNVDAPQPTAQPSLVDGTELLDRATPSIDRRSPSVSQPKESTKLTELSKVEDKAAVNALADNVDAPQSTDQPSLVDSTEPLDQAAHTVKPASLAVTPAQSAQRPGTHQRTITDRHAWIRSLYPEPHRQQAVKSDTNPINPAQAKEIAPVLPQQPEIPVGALYIANTLPMAWTLLGKALQQPDFKIQHQNPADGFFLVEYPLSMNGQSFFSNLAFWNNAAEPIDTQQYQIVLQPHTQGSVIHVLDVAGQGVHGPQGLQLLNRLAGYFQPMQ